MIASALALVATAAALASLDLSYKAAAGVELLHPRSAVYVVVVLVLSVIWAGAIVLTRSLAMAVGGGILTGGALGNAGSLLFWPGVPNPLTIGSLAFNLADVFVLAGFAAVSALALRLARLERERLSEPLRLR